MEPTSVQRLARVLRALVAVALAVNIAVLVMVPCLLMYHPDSLIGGAQGFLDTIRSAGEDDIVSAPIFLLLTGWLFAILYPSTLHLFLCLFFLVCGICTAIILKQAHRILLTIQAGKPFQRANAQAMGKAAACCWVIAGAALIRLVLELVRLGNPAPLFTYNALFIPGFFMAGLLFQVMSALFRQASELKEDQDLTI